MDRRSALAALATAAGGVCPRLAQLQVRRIGVLGLGPSFRLVGPNPAAPDIAAFLQGMREAGYVWGRDFMTVPTHPRSRRAARGPALSA